MKKLSAYIFIAVLCLCCFAACDLLQDTEESDYETIGDEHEHTYETIGDEHEHTYENYRDETGHGWSYTCGCLTPPNFAQHSDGDNDGACDTCGYDLGIAMPENALLVEFESWITQLDAENVAEIKTTFEYVGVAPGQLKNISRTSDKSVIADVIAKYNQVPLMSVPAEDTYISGGNAFTIEFILTDGTVKKLFFNNGHYVYGFNQETLSALGYFRLDAPTLEGYDNVENSYGFITYREYGRVLRFDGSCEPVDVCDIDMSAFEFVEAEAPTDLTESKLCVDTEFGTLVFIGNSIFYIREYGNKYYKLTGQNLDEIIEESLNTEYTLTMNDPEWLYEELSPTYKAGETVSVKIRMAIDLGYIFLVNGKDIATECDTDGKYWEFIFIMPNENVEIDFLTYDGFLPDHNYSVLIKAYWMKNLDAEFVYIERYYGEFESGAIAAMIVSGEHEDEAWEEIIDGTVISYSNSNRIQVYFGGEFYTLTEAFTQGYITKEDLTKIQETHTQP